MVAKGAKMMEYLVPEDEQRQLTDDSECKAAMALLPEFAHPVVNLCPSSIGYYFADI